MSAKWALISCRKYIFLVAYLELRLWNFACSALQLAVVCELEGGRQPDGFWRPGMHIIDNTGSRLDIAATRIKDQYTGNMSNSLTLCLCTPKCTLLGRPDCVLGQASHVDSRRAARTESPIMRRVFRSYS